MICLELYCVSWHVFVFSVTLTDVWPTDGGCKLLTSAHELCVITFKQPVYHSLDWITSMSGAVGRSSSQTFKCVSKSLTLKVCQKDVCVEKCVWKLCLSDVTYSVFTVNTWHWLQHWQDWTFVTWLYVYLISLIWYCMWINVTILLLFNSH